jgi:hypothetical protein
MGMPEQKLASKIARKLREKREDEALNRAMRNLSLNDNVDQSRMDIDAIRGIPIELVQGENGEIMLVQKKR